MRRAHATFLSDTIHSLMVMSVCCTTVPDGGSRRNRTMVEMSKSLNGQHVVTIAEFSGTEYIATSLNRPNDLG